MLSTPRLRSILGVTVNGQPGDSNSLATLNISGATAGAILTDGTHTHTFSGPGDTFDIHSWNLATLTIKPAGDSNFVLTVAATETGRRRQPQHDHHHHRVGDGEPDGADGDAGGGERC